MAVLVLDRKKRPLMPCTPKRARKLLASGRARVHRLFPFCIRLVDRSIEQSAVQPLRLSLDPGSKTTGLAISRIEESVDADGVIEPVMHIVFLMELAHRGRAIMESLQHRIDTSAAWVARFRRLAPITHLAQELVRFDMQLLQNPEISGVAYQQGTLAGYEVREYLLEKFHRTCAYCNAKNVPLQIEHIHAKARGGSNRISNLALACGPCNAMKTAQDIRDFLAKDPARLARILKQVQAPLGDAAAVNATRWALLRALKETGIPVEIGTGGRPKWNRSRLGIQKTHALDAACVGVALDVRGTNVPTLRVKCTGRGSRCKTRLNAHGFPRAYLTRKKTAFGFRTGDMVMAIVPTGKNQGVHKGRVAIRMTGNFNVQSGIAGTATVQGISHKHCRVQQRADGYGYVWQTTHIEQPKARAATASRSASFLTALKDGVSRSKI